jgi:hypothetical protein
MECHALPPNAAPVTVPEAVSRTQGGGGEVPNLNIIIFARF